MSLINDALKRASQSDRDRPRPVSTHTAMLPVADRRSFVVPLVMGAVVVLVLASAAWFFRQWWNVSHAQRPAKVETVANVAPEPAPAPAPSPLVRVVQAPVPPPPVAPAPQPVVAAPAPAPAPAPEPAPAPGAIIAGPWPKELKLGGIFYSKSNPRALISGKTVTVGDEIEGIRITKIDRDQVTIEWQGQVKQLNMD